MQKGAWGCEAAEASRDDDDDDDMFESKGERGGWKRGSNLELGGGPSVAGRCYLTTVSFFLSYSVIVLDWIGGVVIHACVVC